MTAPKLKPGVDGCPECKGSGDCMACDGTGRDGGRLSPEDCDWCGGTGVCVGCNGSGIDTDIEDVIRTAGEG